MRKRASEQALLIPLGVVHARRPLLALSFSFPLSLRLFRSLLPLRSRELCLARANLYTATVRSHAIEHARESCSSSCAPNDPALPMYRSKRSCKKTPENLGHLLRRCRVRLSVNGQTMQGERSVSLTDDDDSENREYLLKISQGIVKVAIKKLNLYKPRL